MFPKIAAEISQWKQWKESKQNNRQPNRHILKTDNSIFDFRAKHSLDWMLSDDSLLKICNRPNAKLCRLLCCFKYIKSNSICVFFCGLEFEETDRMKTALGTFSVICAGVFVFYLMDNHDISTTSWKMHIAVYLSVFTKTDIQPWIRRHFIFFSVLGFLRSRIVSAI